MTPKLRSVPQTTTPGVLSQSVILLLLSQVLSGMLITTQFAFFPIFIEERLGYTAAVISICVALGRAMGMVASLVGGSLVDRLGHKWSFVLGTGAFVFGSVLFLFDTPWLVLLFWGLAAAGLSIRTPAGQSYTIQMTGAQRLGFVSALYTLSVTVGGALGNPGAGVLLDRGGYRAFALGMLAISLLTTGGMAAFLPTPTSEASSRSAAQAKSSHHYGNLIRRPAVAVLGLIRFLPTAYYGMSVVIIPLLINRLSGSKTTVALYLTVSQVVATGVQLLAGWAADRYGHQRPSMTAFGTLILSAAGLAAFSTHLWGLFVFGALGLGAAWSLAALLPCQVSDAVPDEDHGRVLGFLNLAWNAGMIVGSLMGGALVEIATGLPFLVTALMNAPAILLLIILSRLQHATAEAKSSAAKAKEAI